MGQVCAVERWRTWSCFSALSVADWVLAASSLTRRPVRGSVVGFDYCNGFTLILCASVVAGNVTAIVWRVTFNYREKEIDSGVLLVLHGRCPLSLETFPGVVLWSMLQQSTALSLMVLVHRELDLSAAEVGELWNATCMKINCIHAEVSVFWRRLEGLRSLR